MPDFRPRHEPARTLYDAFQTEATHRQGKAPADWQRAELLAVWGAARDWAQQHSKATPALDDVADAEFMARGHVDYGAKWAYAVARLMEVTNA